MATGLDPKHASAPAWAPLGFSAEYNKWIAVGPELFLLTVFCLFHCLHMHSLHCGVFMGLLIHIYAWTLRISVARYSLDLPALE